MATSKADFGMTNHVTNKLEAFNWLYVKLVTDMFPFLYPPVECLTEDQVFILEMFNFEKASKK